MTSTIYLPPDSGKFIRSSHHLSYLMNAFALATEFIFYRNSISKRMNENQTFEFITLNYYLHTVSMTLMR